MLRLGHALVATSWIVVGCDGVLRLPETGLDTADAAATPVRSGDDASVPQEGSGQDSGKIGPPHDERHHEALDGGEASGDTGRPNPSDASVLPDAATASPPGTLPVFIAQGHVGRTVMSCDDGRSWVEDRAFDVEGDVYVCGTAEPTICWHDGVTCQFLRDGMCRTSNGQCDCDHHPGAGRGIAYGDGWFAATWGWGPAGSVRRSRDGINWERVLDDTTFGGITFGLGRWMVGARDPRVSQDSAATWQAGGEADLSSPGGDTIWNVRALAFAPVAGGRFVITGEDGAHRDVLVSTDGGDSFSRPSTLPPGCGAGVLGVAAGGGTIVIAQRNGDVCHSRDGGQSFSVTHVDDSLDSQPLWASDHFVIWRRGVALQSPDGEHWTSTATDPPDLEVGAASYSPVTGTFVAVRGGWQVWYDQQAFYRSSDGVTWTQLAAGAAPGGHPLGHIAFGYAQPSAACR